MDYESKTVSELKELLKARGLKVGGKKAELVERLVEDDQSGPAPIDAKAPPTEESPDQDFELDDAEGFEEEFYEDDWEDDEEYSPKQKPILDEETKAALIVRKTQRASMPKFRRQEWFRYFRLARTGWRKPNGLQSKQRLNMKYRTPMVRIGHRKVASVRGLHPSGFEEVLVKNPSDLDGLNPETQAVRISAAVGNRKRTIIHTRADQLGLRILNRRRIQRKGDLR